MEDPGPWIIEGVSVPRALRKLLARYDAHPADVLYWSSTPREELSKGQTSMGKSCDTVWNVIRDELVARAMRVEAF